MKRFLCLFFALILTVLPLAGCNAPIKTETTGGEESRLPDPIPCTINGVSVTEYTIVYPSLSPDYTKRAATYLSEEIAQRTGNVLSVVSDSEQATPLSHEIVVGETNRDISAALDAQTEGLQFSMLANDAHIAMEGDYFIIAAAAYYFVDTYIKTVSFDAVVEKTERVHEPIVKETKNYIFLIGDGMGVNQTKLFDQFSTEDLRFSDGESAFYGYMLPYQGMSRTDSLSGTTDSAAGGTALATGYKTKNSYVGKDQHKNNVKSLTEMAADLGMATAVMSTDLLTGATPAAFSAHSESRKNTTEIQASQAFLTEKRGTLLLGNYGYNYTLNMVRFRLERDIGEMLTKLEENEKGFFMMYEEAHIDKHSHSNALEDTFSALVRFNQAIGCFMEYAFYHPETMILITADHETGGLTLGEDGKFEYTSEDHTSADVPVFAYGKGAEIFHGKTVENIQIPKTIAKVWGVDLIGYDNETYPALQP